MLTVLLDQGSNLHDLVCAREPTTQQEIGLRILQNPLGPSNTKGVFLGLFECGTHGLLIQTSVVVEGVCLAPSKPSL